MKSIFSSLSNVSLHSVVFLLLLIHHSLAFRHPQCHNDDHSSLLQLKRSFVFDEIYCDPSFEYPKMSSWKVGENCCSWDGIDCDVETGHVIGLNLSSSCIHCSINSSSPLFHLVNLKSLDLSYNNFNLSRIPSAIKSLSQLKSLNLSSSNFIGQIPSDILELSHLVSLHLSGNSLVLEKPSLKDVVESFAHLEELHLTYVTISSHVPQSLLNLTSLSSLILGNCSLLGEFPLGVFRLPNLHFLSLQYNPNLTVYLPEFDNVSSPLEKLSLDGTNLSGQLPVSIGNLKSLGVLSASECCFWGVIPSSVGNLSNLDYLDLSRNYFTGKIPSSLRNLTKLSYLYFNENQLTGSLPSWLGNFTQLIELSVSHNELQGPISESIFRLPYIEFLAVDNNNLSGSLKYGSFLQMQHISELQLGGNHLSIVSSFYMNVTLPKFKILGLGGCNLREFPAFLRSQSELEILFLSDNNIEGHVPNWLFSLESLAYLELQRNSLTGFEQPLSILSLPNLRALILNSNQFKGPLPFPSLSMVVYDVSRNKFSGHISFLFCNLTSALRLDFSSNNLTGALPPCLGNVAPVLNLRNNSFSRAIPDNFTSGCKLKYMDFSQNMFEGKLPHSLAKCFELEILNLNENWLNDVFPSWLGILPHLRVLSLRSNEFHGSVGQPLTEFEFRRLQIIDISNNNFRGKLPVEYFENLVGMKNTKKDHLAYMQANTSFGVLVYRWTIYYDYSIKIVIKGTEREYDRILEFFVVVDLSSNMFEGEIPEIIGTLRALQSLNLSNNMLTGHIPSSLGNLTTLEALDFSRNDLSGQIPTQLSLNTFLAVFNVSHNSLTGPIPKGNQFGTFENSSFFDNPGLCGDILPKKCGKTETSQLRPAQGSEEDDESPFQLNWEIVLIGFGSGLVIGVVFGWALDTRKYEWLVKKRFARRVRRRRRN